NVINFRNNRILAYADNEFDLNGFYQSTLNLASQLGDCVEDSKTKKIINELRKELEEVKKELDNKRNDELAIQPIENKKIIKKDGNSSVSEHEDFKQLENNKNNKIESNLLNVSLN
ncbi:Protein of unknown function (DUF2031), putative, partial [Plasmodium berghei]